MRYSTAIHRSILLGQRRPNQSLCVIVQQFIGQFYWVNGDPISPYAVDPIELTYELNLVRHFAGAIWLACTQHELRHARIDFLAYSPEPAVWFKCESRAVTSS